MNTQAVYAEIKQTKKYHPICDDTILRISGEEAAKYKSEKDAVKSAKARLHRIAGAFVDAQSIRRAEALIHQPEDGAERVRALLKLHASSLERLGFVEEMYRDILRCAMPGARVLDIACGFNPFVLPLLPAGAVSHYTAIDIHTDCVRLVNAFFAARGISGNALAGDILHSVPVEAVDIALLCKILPLLEQQRKGSALRVVGALQAKLFAISFPIRSLSGKNVGMYGTYRRFMEETFFAADYRCVFEKEYANELLFVIARATEISPGAESL